MLERLPSTIRHNELHWVLTLSHTECWHWATLSVDTGPHWVLTLGHTGCWHWATLGVDTGPHWVLTLSHTGCWHWATLGVDTGCCRQAQVLGDRRGRCVQVPHGRRWRPLWQPSLQHRVWHVSTSCCSSVIVLAQFSKMRKIRNLVLRTSCTVTSLWRHL